MGSTFATVRDLQAACDKIRYADQRRSFVAEHTRERCVLVPARELDEALQARHLDPRFRRPHVKLDWTEAVCLVSYAEWVTDPNASETAAPSAGASPAEETESGPVSPDAPASSCPAGGGSAESNSGTPASQVFETPPETLPIGPQTGSGSGENRSAASRDSSGSRADCQPLPALPLVSTPRFKKALALAMKQARRAGREWVGTEDLRAGLEAVEAEKKLQQEGVAAEA